MKSTLGWTGFQPMRLEFVWISTVWGYIDYIGEFRDKLIELISAKPGVMEPISLEVCTIL